MRGSDPAPERPPSARKDRSANTQRPRPRGSGFSSPEPRPVAPEHASQASCQATEWPRRASLRQPHGPNPIEKATLEGLWGVVTHGSKYVEYYSYLADTDPMRQRVALSQFAQCLKHAMDHFRESHVKAVMKDEAYAKVEKLSLIHI